MTTIKYYSIKLLSKLLSIIGQGDDLIIKEMRKEGMTIGINNHISSNIAPYEPYLVEIGNFCTISTDVSFITHDASIGVFMGRKNYSDLCGKIRIGNNCFIGKGSIILYGVTIPDNTLVAAGSVVTKSVQEPGLIIGGNPAKIIGKTSNFIDKSKDFMLSLHGKSYNDRKNEILKSNKLIYR